MATSAGEFSRFTSMRLSCLTVTLKEKETVNLCGFCLSKNRVWGKNCTSFGGVLESRTSKLHGLGKKSTMSRA